MGSMGHVRETLRAITWSFVAATVAACSGGGGSEEEGSGRQATNQDPVASFSTSAMSGDAPLTVGFDASLSSDSDGTITTFDWDFGDTSTGFGNPTTHTFAQPGSFTVVLTVRDDDGATATTSRVITANQAVTTFQLSGTIIPLTSSAVDGDVNDPFSAFLANDAMASAQAIPNPVTLGGYVNIAGAGPTGRSKVTGDPADFYMITLTGQETLILSIADANPLINDLDIRLRDSNGMVVDESVGISETEVIQAPGPGTFFIEVLPFAGASNYVLTIGDQTAQGLRDDMAPLRLSADFRPGEMVLQVEPDAIESEMRAMIAANGLAIARDGGEFKLLEIASPRLLSSMADALPMDADLREKHETLMALKALRKQPGVVCAEPNYVRKVHRVPNDSFYGVQWHYPAVNLPAAWDITTGSPNVIVAVIDTGILTNHPELIGQQVPGYDFISDPVNANDGDGIDDNPIDPGDESLGGVSSFHGTHVAGTVAAATDNASGVAGVAWRSKIMPLRALGKNGGASFDIIQSIRFAAGLPNDSGTLPARRADVINMSIGGPSSSAAEQSVMDQARAQGLILVASAGNSATNAPMYPASYNGVISVSATTIQNQIAFYSNFGGSIDVAAPGGDPRTDINGDGVGDGVLSTLGDDSSGVVVMGIGVLSGTSMASPHVAGIAALMKAVHPALTPAELDLLLASGQITDDLGTPGRDDAFGHGLINARKAVDAALGLAGGGNQDTPILSVTPGSLAFGSATTEITMTVSNAGSGNLTIMNVSDDVNWLTVTPASVDASGLGTYTATASRASLMDGIFQATITVTSSANDVTVPITLQVASAGFEPNAGLHFVLLLDNATDLVVKQMEVLPQNGQYPYTFTNVEAGTYEIIAGTDFDNDMFICDGGESCGVYQTIEAPTAIAVNRDMSGLDFSTGYRLNIVAAVMSEEGETSPATGVPRDSERRIPARQPAGR